MPKSKEDKLTKTIEESVVTAMDGADSHLFPYLPYIMQDFWEIGTSPDIVVELVNKHAADYSNLKVLDLGCGKGAVLIQLAKALNCYCYGVDAVKAFIDEAEIKAKELNVDEYCCFECGDIRAVISDLQDYDIIILGSIGPALGGYYSTLTQLSECLNDNGLIIIDDGYIDDSSQYSHPHVEKRSEILKQISDAGMELVDEIILDKDDIKASDDLFYHHIKRRCEELIEKHPDKKALFIDYIRNQEEENEVLEEKVVCSTMLFRKNG